MEDIRTKFSIRNHQSSAVMMDNIVWRCLKLLQRRGFPREGEENNNKCFTIILLFLLYAFSNVERLKRTDYIANRT